MIEDEYDIITNSMTINATMRTYEYDTCLITQRLALAIGARSAVSSHRQLRVTRLSRFLSRLTHMRIVCLPLIVSRGTAVFDVSSRLVSRSPYSLLNTRLTLDPRVTALSERVRVAQFLVGAIFKAGEILLAWLISTFILYTCSIFMASKIHVLRVSNFEYLYNQVY